MVKRARALFERYREPILYVFFGGCTTVINIVVYYAATRFVRLDTTGATVAAWLLSVLFAYVTNRIWVFESRSRELRSIARELASFYGARLATGLMDLGIMYLLVDVLGLNDMVIKILSNVLVIVLNYVLSKLFIFKK